MSLHNFNVYGVFTFVRSSPTEIVEPKLLQVFTDYGLAAMFARKFRDRAKTEGKDVRVLISASALTTDKFMG